MDPKNNNQNQSAQAAAGPQVNLGNISVGMSDDEQQDYINAWQSSISSSSSTPNTGFGTTGSLLAMNGVSTGPGNFISLDDFTIGGDDIEDRFIEVTSHLSEDDVSAMLDKLKSFSERSYHKSLIGLISYPNYRQLSERFLTERFTDIKRSIKMFNSKFRFEMVYGKTLDAMPGLKLLIEMNKDKK
jgi:hypothetical protein